VIQIVGSVIGREHIVSLKDYEVLIMVETVKNITGMSVVRDFDRLRRFNVEQLYDQYQSSLGNSIKVDQQEDVKDGKSDFKLEEVQGKSCLPRSETRTI